MNNTLKDILEQTTHERMFPILNKFQRIWEYDKDKTFCEIYNNITQGKKYTDLELTKEMDKYIDYNEIK